MAISRLTCFVLAFNSFSVSKQISYFTSKTGLFGNGKRNWNSGHTSCSRSHRHVPQTKERKRVEKKEGVGKRCFEPKSLERMENSG